MPDPLIEVLHPAHEPFGLLSAAFNRASYPEAGLREEGSRVPSAADETTESRPVLTSF